MMINRLTINDHIDLLTCIAARCRATYLAACCSRSITRQPIDGWRPTVGDVDDRQPYDDHGWTTTATTDR